MKRLDDGKVSLVEFLRSIKFKHRSMKDHRQECGTHFAGFKAHARRDQAASAEESQLVRSAN